MIDDAIEVFVRGFTTTRSFTHPYLADRVGPLWVMRDGPRKRSADYRTEEWVARGTPAAEVDAAVRRETRGRFAVCHILPAGEDDAGVRADYKSLGYRLIRTEALMTRPAAPAGPVNSPAAVRRVASADHAARLAKAAGSRQLLDQHLTDDAVRVYTAEIDGQIVGYVRSIAVGQANWCASMHVDPAHRRKKIATALMARMLSDDAERGSTRSVLLSSHTGATLYPTLGYDTIGTLLLLTPRAR